jgi:hypothetical protein
MAEIRIDPEELDASVSRIVHAKLAIEGKELLGDAQALYRKAIQEIQESSDKFREKSRAELKDGEDAIDVFKKKLSDTLSVKFLAIYAAALLIVSIAAVGYLAQRGQTVLAESNALQNKTEQLKLQAEVLDRQAKQLQDSIDSATAAVDKMALSNASMTSQLAGLLAANQQMRVDLQQMQTELKSAANDDPQRRARNKQN